MADSDSHSGGPGRLPQLPVDQEAALAAEARQRSRFDRCDLAHPMMRELLEWCVYREALRLTRRGERLDAGG